MILRRAVLRLTILMTLVILASIALFAVAVDRYVTYAFDLELPADSEQSVNATLATLHAGLGIGFALLTLITPFVSYVLARRSLNPVRVSMESQQRFVDDAAHELRTPIAVAQGELELALLRERTPEEYRTASRAALTALADLGSLTDALLLLTRSGDLTAAGESARFSPDDAARRAIQAMPAEIRERIRFDTSGGTATITGNADLVARAIANLLENSARYAEPGSEIRLRVEQGSTVTRFVVADRGPGLSASDAVHAFDRFWRAASSRQSAGNGIGLSIVQRIIEGHGGKVTLHSVPGTGTTATIALPVAR
ncbi:sensor histidine kinase [Microbacterium xylanilyticum]